ncbi:hypothetical protein [Massilia sp. TSP1-1-2]|uniref:hypothetical protein n=1 Tax=Massilia sp. TSP1-1-2 TaxID=2804649 RepID=UPI003CEDE819
MIVGYESSTQKFRERTDASVVFVLRRKKCACGKEVTAKQLTQYSACRTCVAAAIRRVA